MNMLVVVVSSAVILTVAYFTYGRLLTRLFKLDATRPTPAVELRDDVDYEPIEPKFLLSQHFSAIAAAGPVVGPILAGLMFGWVPALCWILVGSIFIGGVHDMAALTASIRHKARSIAEVVRDHMSQRSYVLFLLFVWIALIYIIVAFTDITASAFIRDQVIENGVTVRGAGIATSSMFYLVLPVIMGLLLRYTKLSLNLATVIFLPLVGVAIWAGQQIPFDLTAILNVQPAVAHKVWDVALLFYCLIAAVVPVWALLQPRGHLGGYFLYVALAAGAIGLIAGGNEIKYPAFLGWDVLNAKGETRSIFPILFITIACGACSGFHSLIASGTTSKQLSRETDARTIGYGAMLLEAMVAIVSLCCVMMFAQGAPELGGAKPSPDHIYSQGIGNFVSVMYIPKAFGISFALMAFTTFVYDTLDVCTRLGRYIIQELTGMQGSVGRWLGTGLTAGIPVFFLLRHPSDSPQPVWRLFWDLFGASNQLLAALTLMGITVWLWRTRRAAWVWLVTGLPAAFMYTMSTWALYDMTWRQFRVDGAFVAPSDPIPWIGLVLLALAALMLVEAVIAVLGSRGDDDRSSRETLPATSAAS
ncbi:MAG: carbon starvation protein A [Planctomycetes bacterium]|nr:carbon starvation protein A [Planctomycetota bacterium]